MNINMIGWEFPPNIDGGMGIHCYEICKRLIKNHKIDFFIPNRDTDIALQTENNMNVHFIHCDPHDDTLLGLLAKVKSYNRNISLAPTEPYIIHGHDWMSTPSLKKIKKKTNAPLVFTLHSTERGRAGHTCKRSRITKLEIKGTQIADKVITVSKTAKNELIENFNTNPNKIIPIYNGVDSKKFEAPLIDIRKKYHIGNKPLILFLGRLAEQKGPEYLLLAAQTILEKIPDCHFLFVGKGHLTHTLKAFTKSLDLESNVTFTGFVPDKHLSSYYHAADVYVAPSIYEPFGITIAESMAAKTPVITTNIAGAAEDLENGKDLVKVQPKNAEQISDAVIKLLTDKSLRNRIANNGHRIAKKEFTWKNTVKKLESIYNTLT